MLYHYTSIEKLKSILATQQFWMTKISDFDDLCEFYHTISMVSKELSMLSEDRSWLFNEMEKYSNNIFVGCFCNDGDSLFLWKNYGDFNIEFSKEDLNNSVRYQQSTMGYISEYSNFLRCEYQKERQEAIIKGALAQWNKENNYTIPVHDLSHLSTIFKKPDFCTEQETRLVLHLKDGAPIKAFDKFNYWDLPLRTNNNSQLVKSITIGPTNRADEVERDLRAYLKKQQIENIAIKHSEITLRELSDSKPFNQKICQNCECFIPTPQCEINKIS